MTYPTPPGPTPPDPTPPGEPGYGPPPYDQPVVGYSIPGYYATPEQMQAQPYAYPPYPYPHPAYAWQPPRPTDGMAIAALVVSCVGVAGLCTYGIGGVMGLVGAILGHVARRRIRRSGYEGAGMALAGIIVGWCLTAISVAIAALVITLIITDPGS